MKSVNTLFISLKINAILPIIILLRSFSLDSEFPVSGTFESEVGPKGAEGPEKPEESSLFDDFLRLILLGSLSSIDYPFRLFPIKLSILVSPLDSLACEILDSYSSYLLEAAFSHHQDILLNLYDLS